MNQIAAELPKVEAMQEPVVGGDIAMNQQPSTPASGDYNSLSNRILRSRPGIALATFVTALGIGGSAELMTATTASAQSATENSLVCGGVHSEAQALNLAQGGADACGHRDIGKAWAKVGITPQVIKTMHWGTVSSNDGLISEGRLHSPNRAEDHPVNLGDGDTIFTRPLSVWGEATYSALVGYTEDGHEVAILEGCGNGEGHIPPKPHHKPPKHHHHKPPKTAEVEVLKIAEDDQGHQLPATPTGTFRFEVKCKDGSKNIDQVVVYNETPQPLAECNVGSQVTVDELSPLGNEQWKQLSPSEQGTKVGSHGSELVFKDQEVPPNIPPPNIPPPPPTTPPPVHGCEVSNIIEKDGRTDNLTVTTDSGATTPAQETIDWGDGQTSTYVGVAPIQTEDHFYNQDATFTETVTETFADGGTAICTGVVTTQQESAPPPPPA